MDYLFADSQFALVGRIDQVKTTADAHRCGARVARVSQKTTVVLSTPDVVTILPKEFLKALALHIPVVNVEWFHTSLEQGQVADVEKYLIQAPLSLSQEAIDETLKKPEAKPKKRKATAVVSDSDSDWEAGEERQLLSRSKTAAKKEGPASRKAVKEVDEFELFMGYEDKRKNSGASAAAATTMGKLHNPSYQVPCSSQSKENFPPSSVSQPPLKKAAKAASASTDGTSSCWNVSLEDVFPKKTLPPRPVPMNHTSYSTTSYNRQQPQQPPRVPAVSTHPPAAVVAVTTKVTTKSSSSDTHLNPFSVPQLHPPPTQRGQRLSNASSTSAAAVPSPATSTESNQPLKEISKGTVNIVKTTVRFEDSLRRSAPPTTRKIVQRGMGGILSSCSTSGATLRPATTTTTTSSVVKSTSCKVQPPPKAQPNLGATSSTSSSSSLSGKLGLPKLVGGKVVSSSSGSGKSRQDDTSMDDHPLATKVRDSEYIKNKIDPSLWKMILRDVVDNTKSMSWEDVGGMAAAKKILYETVILPYEKPFLFRGWRKPSRGLLMFGPPGTGKTMLARVVASQCKCVFLTVSASSLLSKWMGEGEKLVQALFAVARALQPSIIFIDEVDSLLSSRSSTEHEASRRLKTEFLVQIDGVCSQQEDRIFIFAASNRPQDLDEAVVRRFTKRVYIPLPDADTRRCILQNILKTARHSLSEKDFDTIIDLTQKYSGSDLTSLCEDVAMQPLREVKMDEVCSEEDVRAVNLADFLSSLQNVKPSASSDSAVLEKWNAAFGSTA